MTQDRLIAGAKMLGELWRAGVRCKDGWMVSCSCEPMTKFCRAKGLWVKIAQEAGRTFDQEPIVGGMTAQEIKASGVTVQIHVPEHGLVKFGPDPDAIDPEVLSLPRDVLVSIVGIMKVFPKAKVEVKEKP